MESGQKSPEEIRREVVETQEELGETVEAIAQKTDVKKQTKKKLAETQETMKGKAGEVQETVTARVGEAQEKVSVATPEPAKRTATQAAESLRERPLPSIAIAALVVGGLVLGWTLARR